MTRWLLALLLVAMPLGASAKKSKSEKSSGSKQAAPAATFVAAGKAPKIKFTNVKWDFGKVEEGPEVKHLYRFTNLGGTLLKIERVQPSCGCTGAEAEGRNEIPPGERGAIRVTYNTNGRPGHTVKTVTVVTNDPNNQSVVLSFEVDVVREIDVQPDRASFYGLKKGESRTVQIKILGKEGAPLSILSAKSVNGAVAVSLSALVEPVTQNPLQGTPTPVVPKVVKRYGGTLDVLLPGDKPIGTFNDEILCTTDSKKKPEIRIPVSGEVVGRVQVNPRDIYLYGPGGQSTYANVVANPPEGFAVRRVKMARGQVKPWVKKTRGPDGKTLYQVELTISKSLPDGPIEDEMTIYTNDPDQSELKVQVKGNKSTPPKP